MLLLGHGHVEVLLRHRLLRSLLILHILLRRIVVVIGSPAVLLLRLIRAVLGHLIVVGRLEADAARSALHHVGTLTWHWHHAWRPTLILIWHETRLKALALWHGLTRGLEWLRVHELLRVGYKTWLCLRLWHERRRSTRGLERLRAWLKVPECRLAFDLRRLHSLAGTLWHEILTSCCHLRTHRHRLRHHLWPWILLYVKVCSSVHAVWHTLWHWSLLDWGRRWLEWLARWDERL